MTTSTQHLGLIAPTTVDGFRTSDLAANWAKLDQYPGTYICTSITRPVGWGANQTGVQIFETDSGLRWWWDGAAFNRTNPMGWINSSTRTADFQTTQQIAQVVVTCNANIPAGNRHIQVIASYGKAEGSAGQAMLSLWRDSTQLTEWTVIGDSTSGTALNQGEGHTFIFHDSNVSAVTHAYSFRARANATFGGTVFVRSSGSSQPITIDVVEV